MTGYDGGSEFELFKAVLANIHTTYIPLKLKSLITVTTKKNHQKTSTTNHKQCHSCNLTHSISAYTASMSMLQHVMIKPVLKEHTKSSKGVMRYCDVEVCGNAIPIPSHSHEVIPVLPIPMIASYSHSHFPDINTHNSHSHMYCYEITKAEKCRLNY